MMLKHNQQLRNLRRFYSFFRPYLFRSVLAIIITSLVGAMGGVMAYLLKPYMDDVVFGDGSIGSLFYPMLIIAFSVTESLLNFGSNYLTTWVGMRVSNDVKMALFRKLIHSDPATFDKASSGEIMTRYSGDASTASATLLTNVKNLITRVVTSVFLVAVMLYLSWMLALVAVACLAITVVPLAYVRKKLKKYIAESVKVGAQSTTNYNETYHGNRIITSYNLYDYTYNRLDSSLKKLFRLSIKMLQRTNALSLVMHFATSIGIAAAVWLQGYLIAGGHITPGDFVACITALVMLYTPIKKMGPMLTTIQTCTMAIERIYEKLDQEPKIKNRPGAKPMHGIRNGIRYSDVSFSYAPGKPVLRNISLDIRAGETVAFVGNSGGGKTTLVNLLPRFYDVDSGAIFIDGVDVRDIERESLRGMIAIVFQDNFLFGGTIRDNIVLGKKDATEAQIAQAVKAACLDEFINSLHRGLDTEIGERGVLLSGGQKQRVAIARAFIKDAPIVILDEATSALDTKSEKVVQQAIENLMLNKTVLIIAHRLSTVINSDRIVVIKDGYMVESGTHSELLAQEGGVYRSLYQTQLA